MLKHLKLKWHSIRYRLNVMAFLDCLDEEMKEEFNRKMQYHKEKIRKFEAL
ncbi:hypothetical protein [Bacillus solitudinis]|uniref:hypothetical protein n=1 Tax=Bacillus solitudinis TaxID=2014074 RepID=UPI0012FE0DA0|nr:hypothetical protein [Bacillus solitudinis]